MSLHPRAQVTQPTDPSYRLIALTQGQVTKVDSEDYDWLMQWKWYAQWNVSVRSFYAVRYTTASEGYSPRERMAMHRVIMKAPPDMEVDHEFHDTLDNRKFRLRVVTKIQNLSNRRARYEARDAYGWSKSATEFLLDQ